MQFRDIPFCCVLKAFPTEHSSKWSKLISFQNRKCIVKQSPRLEQHIFAHFLSFIHAESFWFIFNLIVHSYFSFSIWWKLMTFQGLFHFQEPYKKGVVSVNIKPLAIYTICCQQYHTPNSAVILTSSTNQVQISGKASCVSLRANALGRTINQSLSPFQLWVKNRVCSYPTSPL